MNESFDQAAPPNSTPKSDHLDWGHRRTSLPERGTNGVSSGHLDELLDELPRVHHHLGALAPDPRGRRAWRIGVAVAFIIGLAGGAGLIYRIWKLEYDRQHPFELSPPTPNPPRVFYWTEGNARLGLTRDEPGIRAIVLPDKVLTLAPGCDYAQVNVRVVDGITVAWKAISGEVVERLPEAQSDLPEVSPPAPPATR